MYNGFDAVRIVAHWTVGRSGRGRRGRAAWRFRSKLNNNYNDDDDDDNNNSYNNNNNNNNSNSHINNNKTDIRTTRTSRLEISGEIEIR